MRIAKFHKMEISLATSSGEHPFWIELEIKGPGYCVWPNREGEGFDLNRVFPVLNEHDCLDCGLNLSWPATASTGGAAFFSEEGPGILFQLDDDPGGHNREIRITADGPDKVILRFTGIQSGWSVKDLPERKPSGIPPKADSLQFQVGLIDPQGNCGIPDSRGFDYLGDLACLLTKKYGPFTHPPIIHLFGYAHGHDRGYPDYTPAERLGGIKEFKKMTLELHQQGFLLSCYLNGRIMEAAQLEKFPHLKPGICVDTSNRSIVEIYYDRKFYVMNPNFSPWLEELERKALSLKKLGADIVQLDQVAGRAAAVPPGEIWGDGYARLIANLQRKGLKVWIQGVSDYYNADWFEMTWRDVSILPGGIIRGGNPFGKTDLTLLKIFHPKGRYLVPQSKLDNLEKGDYSVICDVLGDRGGLPVINEKYLKDIKSL